MKSLPKFILCLSVIALFTFCKQKTSQILTPDAQNCFGTHLILKDELGNFLVDTVSESRFEFAGGFLPVSALQQLLDSLNTNTVYMAVGVSPQGVRELMLSSEDKKTGLITFDSSSSNVIVCYHCKPPVCCPDSIMVSDTSR